MESIFTETLGYLRYLLPSLVVGVIAYYFFKLHIDNEERRRRFLIHQETTGETLPLRLQAYERMTLFLERIDPNKLLIRVKPNGNNLLDYEKLLIHTIEQEFEHNLTQQIYLSKEAWNFILTSKNATIQIIRNTVKENTIAHPNKFREEILTHYLDKIAPSKQAILYLKDEVSQLW